MIRPLMAESPRPSPSGLRISSKLAEVGASTTMSAGEEEGEVSRARAARTSRRKTRDWFTRPCPMVARRAVVNAAGRAVRGPPGVSSWAEAGGGNGGAEEGKGEKRGGREGRGEGGTRGEEMAEGGQTRAEEGWGSKKLRWKKERDCRGDFELSTG